MKLNTNIKTKLQQLLRVVIGTIGLVGDIGIPLKVFCYGGQNKNLQGLKTAKVFLLGIGSLLIITLFSCSLKDTRDICCDDIVIDFRYSKGSADVFKDHIQTIRHYIFSESGLLVDVILQPANLQQIKPTNLPNGKYTIVSIGNMSNKTFLKNMEVGKTMLSEMYLYMNALGNGSCMSNGDKLYFGSRTFERKTGTYTRYISDMSNIHAVLKVTVKWEGDAAPSKTGNYTMGLRMVSAKYNLNVTDVNRIIITNPKKEAGYECTPTKVVHSFPVIFKDSVVSHCLDAPINNATKVIGEFVTFRYDDDLIPLFCLYYNGAPVMKEIDLSKAFKAWNVAVTKNTEQVYDIVIEIRKDGTIRVTQAFSAGVQDWDDGGTITGRT